MKLTADLWTIAIKALDDVKGLPDEVIRELADVKVCGWRGKEFP